MDSGGGVAFTAEGAGAGLSVAGVAAIAAGGAVAGRGERGATVAFAFVDDAVAGLTGSAAGTAALALFVALAEGELVA